VGQSQPLVSRHLAQLRRGGLVGPRRVGKQVFSRIASPLAAWLLEGVGAG
jgi:DNA-binding transcriptional ArsR family regulator